MSAAWCVYLVRCADGALYTGIATDVERRIDEHRAGRGAKSLRGRGPLELAASWDVEDRGVALRIEHRIKRLPKSSKEDLVSGEASFENLRKAAGG